MSATFQITAAIALNYGGHDTGNPDPGTIRFRVKYDDATGKGYVVDSEFDYAGGVYVFVSVARTPTTTHAPYTYDVTAAGTGGTSFTATATYTGTSPVKPIFWKVEWKYKDYYTATYTVDRVGSTVQVSPNVQASSYKSTYAPKATTAFNNVTATFYYKITHEDGTVESSSVTTDELSTGGLVTTTKYVPPDNTAAAAALKALIDDAWASRTAATAAAVATQATIDAGKVQAASISYSAAINLSLAGLSAAAALARAQATADALAKPVYTTTTDTSAAVTAGSATGINNFPIKLVVPNLDGQIYSETQVRVGNTTGAYALPSSGLAKIGTSSAQMIDNVWTGIYSDGSVVEHASAFDAATYTIPADKVGQTYYVKHTFALVSATQYMFGAARSNTLTVVA
jgi:hypothetical protein